MTDIFETTHEEFKAIQNITARTLKRFPELDKICLEMDITVVHNTVGLRLKELSETDDFNFFHDVCGIISNLNRKTLELENCFSPRFSI